MSHDILCLSSTDWDGVWGSRQQIMERLGRRGHRVLFLERPAGPEHLLRRVELRRRRVRRWREGLREIVPNVWIAAPPPLLPGRYYSTRLSHLNARLVAPFVRRWLNRLAFTDPILWTYIPDSAPHVKKYGEKLSIYHCIDEFTAGTSGRKMRVIAALERALLERVDIVFANSPPTFENKRRFNPKTFRVPSGVDTTRFTPGDRPDLHPLLAHIPAPRIGYIGHFNDRLDFDLLHYAAASRPGYSFLFIGDTYPMRLDAAPISRLLSLANTYYLGKQPFAVMPSLLHGMDASIIPYLTGDRGRYRSPLKLYEYLAAGLPVVSSPNPEVEEFSAYLCIGRTNADFVDCLDEALLQDTPERRLGRMRLAEQHSWGVRVDQMESLIAEHLTFRGVDNR